MAREHVHAGRVAVEAVRASDRERRAVERRAASASVVPSCDVTGDAGSRPAFGSRISIDVVEVVHVACRRAPSGRSPRSRCVPAASRGASPAGQDRVDAEDEEVLRRRDGVGHADAGSCTVASWPGSLERASSPSVMPTSPPAADRPCGVLSIVTATRNGVRVPLASSSSPERTCRPSASEPVANVSSLPETVGAGAATPSSSAPGAVTGSLAVSTIWLADVETEPSAGSDETRLGAVLSKRTFARTRRRRRVAERVVADRAQVVEAVGERARVEVGVPNGRARVGGDLRPGAGAGRARRRTTTRAAPPLVVAVSDDRAARRRRRDRRA